MYTTYIFEEAFKACGFQLDQVKLKNHQVARATGFIPGNRKVVWDDGGRCFSLRGKRLEKFDLSLQSIVEEKKLKNFKNVCGY